MDPDWLEVLDEVDDSPCVPERLDDVLIASFVGELDLEALCQERHLAQPVDHRRGRVLRGLIENIGVGPERGLGPRSFHRLDLHNLRDSIPVFEGLFPEIAVPNDLNEGSR